ncbi:hypothetical protein [Xanthomonas floridensis]|uniref:Uncharacterized protein n=1 Tax=Xanthomonas floridensis TaxID=1843580 RepID=A0ABU5PVG6_9XANT|nr:hypothetical protein [Xanthomonas floridensis]MEA5123327.1 hypothetical protein [Xanthomonas floridensis]MEA5132706.1 hypothetical protein [Xanthomonas floridensis]
MATLIILLGVLALGHFLYEGVIAPSLRDRLNDEMFELRDRLRRIKLEQGEACPQQAFEIAHNGINQYVHRLHWVTISFVVEFNRSHRKFRNEVKDRRDVIARCGVSELKDVVDRGNQIVERALIVNSGAVLLVSFPFVVLGVTVFQLPIKLYAKAAELFATPERRTEQVLSKLHLAT